MQKEYERRADDACLKTTSTSKRVHASKTMYLEELRVGLANLEEMRQRATTTHNVNGKDDSIATHRKWPVVHGALMSGLSVLFNPVPDVFHPV